MPPRTACWSRPTTSRASARIRREGAGRARPELVRALDEAVLSAERRHPGLPVYVLGESMGAAVAMSAMGAAEPPPVAGLILVAPAVWNGADLPGILPGDLAHPGQHRPGLARQRPQSQATGLGQYRDAAGAGARSALLARYQAGRGRRAGGADDRGPGGGTRPAPADAGAPGRARPDRAAAGIAPVRGDAACRRPARSPPTSTAGTCSCATISARRCSRTSWPGSTAAAAVRASTTPAGRRRQS